MSEKQITHYIGDNCTGGHQTDDPMADVMAAVEGYAGFSVPYLIIDDGPDEEGDPMIRHTPDPTTDAQFAAARIPVRQAVARLVVAVLEKIEDDDMGTYASLLGVVTGALADWRRRAEG